MKPTQKHSLTMLTEAHFPAAEILLALKESVLGPTPLELRLATKISMPNKIRSATKQI